MTFTFIISKWGRRSGAPTLLLIFGLKMLLAMNEYINSLGALVGLNLNIPHIEVPTSISLIVIFGVLAMSMLLSFIMTKHEQV